GLILSGGYIDRSRERVVEDECGISVEQFNALACNGGGLNYFLGNPNSTSDIFVNPNGQTFVAVDESPITCAAFGDTLANGNQHGAFDCALRNAINNPSAANAAAVQNMGLPASCVDRKSVV